MSIEIRKLVNIYVIFAFAEQPRLLRLLRGEFSAPVIMI